MGEDPARYKLKEGPLHHRRLEGETVAVDTRSTNYLTFNRTATLLWDLLVEGATRDQLVDHLLAEFTVDRAVAEADVDAFLASLAREDLLDR